MRKLNKKVTIKEGHKHHTATFYISGELVPLNFNDLALHVVLTANDNKHRKNYDATGLVGFLNDIIKIGYTFKQIRTQQDFKDMEKELTQIYKKYYPNRRNFVKLDVSCELPEIAEGLPDYPKQRKLFGGN